MGNRKTDDKTTTQWSYNKNNELQNFDNTSFKYNKNGQLTEKTQNSQTTYYSYNLDGRLKEIKNNSNQVIATYQYDPFGRRISKTLPQDDNKVIYFHYSQEGLIGEYNEVGVFIQSYGYKPGSDFSTYPVFTHRTNFLEEKGYAFYINDSLATPQKLILRNGREVWEASADAFGKIVVINDEFRNPLRFPGQFSDGESSLRYNYHRYYDPSLGRYITSDPIGLKGGLNTYAYVEGNPLNFIDPEGLSRVLPWFEPIVKPRTGPYPNSPANQGTRAIPRDYTIPVDSSPMKTPENDRCDKERLDDIIKCGDPQHCPDNFISKSKCHTKAWWKWFRCKNNTPDDKLDPPGDYRMDDWRDPGFWGA